MRQDPPTQRTFKYVFNFEKPKEIIALNNPPGRLFAC